MKTTPPSKEYKINVFFLGSEAHNFLLDSRPWASSQRPCISVKEAVKG